MGNAEEMILRANSLYKALIRRDTYENDLFDFSRYKWVIGHKAYKVLEENIPLKLHREEQPTLFSIPVDISLVRPYCIELWENITEKL